MFRIQRNEIYEPFDMVESIEWINNEKFSRDELLSTRYMMSENEKVLYDLTEEFDVLLEKGNIQIPELIMNHILRMFDNIISDDSIIGIMITSDDSKNEEYEKIKAIIDKPDSIYYPSFHLKNSRIGRTVVYGNYADTVLDEIQKCYNDLTGNKVCTHFLTLMEKFNTIEQRTHDLTDLEEYYETDFDPHMKRTEISYFSNCDEYDDEDDEDEDW